MDLEGDSNAGTSAGFLHQLHWRHFGPLKLIRDNTPGTHRPRQGDGGGAGPGGRCGGSLSMCMIWPQPIQLRMRLVHHHDLPQ